MFPTVTTYEKMNVQISSQKVIQPFHIICAKIKKGLYAKFLPRGIIQQLTKTSRGAMKIHSENNGTAKELKHLLKRGPYHVFGNRTKCDSGCT